MAIQKYVYQESLIVITLRTNNILELLTSAAEPEAITHTHNQHKNSTTLKLLLLENTSMTLRIISRR